MPALACALAVVGEVGTGAAASSSDTGFRQPFAGAAKYERLAPPKLAAGQALHQPIGRAEADRIAAAIGLHPKDAFTPRQFRRFITGRGVGGRKNAARMLDRSVKIFTNTAGRPLYSHVDGHLTRSVLGSYGLFVTRAGLLQSLANSHAPTRRANRLIQPGGYLGNWCIHNHAIHTLRALYRSAYTVEAAYGFASQSVSGTAQLVKNTLDGETRRVGMSMVPSIWIVNFALVYVLKPSLAAQMPAQWAPIPRAVVRAIKTSRTGQVSYAKYRHLLH